jgi:hypothetical protein
MAVGVWGLVLGRMDLADNYEICMMMKLSQIHSMQLVYAGYMFYVKTCASSLQALWLSPPAHA